MLLNFIMKPSTIPILFHTTARRCQVKTRGNLCALSKLEFLIPDSWL